MMMSRLTAARSLIAQRRAVAWRLTPSSKPRESRDPVNPKNRASASLLPCPWPTTRHPPTQPLTNWSMKPMNKTLVCVGAISFFALAASACSTTQFYERQRRHSIRGRSYHQHQNCARPLDAASAALIAGDVGSAVAKGRGGQSEQRHGPERGRQSQQRRCLDGSRLRPRVQPARKFRQTATAAAGTRRRTRRAASRRACG